MKNSFVINGLNREQVESVETALHMLGSIYELSKEDSLRLLLTQGALQAKRCGGREDTTFNKEIINLISQAKSRSAAKRARKTTAYLEQKVQNRKRVKQIIESYA